MKIMTLTAAVVLLAGTAVSQTVNDPTLVVEKVVPDNVLNEPISMEFIGDNDLLITEQGGKVRLVTNGAVQPDPVLTVHTGTGERGLLGMALDPDFSNNSFVYLYYTVAVGDYFDPPTSNRVSRFTWNGTALVDEQVVIDLPVTPGPNHNGGIILFGPPNAAPADQKLFIVIGDLNRNNKTENYPGGDDADNTAVILRVNADGSVPSGADKGPFFDVAGSNASLKTMYAYGVRNSFGMDFDPVTNKLWDTENGASDNDEINQIAPGFNSGWETVMGFQDPLPTNLVQFSGVGTYSNPEFTWQSVVAPTAIHFYRGNTLGAEYENECFAGCFNNGKLYRFQPVAERDGFLLTGDLSDSVLNTGESDASIVFGQGFGPISDITTGPDGNLYVLTIDPDTLNSANMLYRIRPDVNAVRNWNLYE